MHPVPKRPPDSNRIILNEKEKVILNAIDDYQKEKINGSMKPFRAMIPGLGKFLLSHIYVERDLQQYEIDRHSSEDFFIEQMRQDLKNFNISLPDFPGQSRVQTHFPRN
jgi:hypothetical protein